MRRGVGERARGPSQVQDVRNARREACQAGGEGPRSESAVHLLILRPSLIFNDLQKPELVQVEAQIAHSSRKRDNARKIADQVVKDAERQRARLDKLARDLEVVRRAADDAQGD